VAAALISIAMNPFVFSAFDSLSKWLDRRRLLAGRTEPAANELSELPMSTEPRYLSNQVVLVGWGRVGRSIADALAEHRIPFVVAEENREFVQALRARGIPAVWGDATEPEVLVQSHIAKARALVIATPETVHVRKMAAIARQLNPTIHVIVRSHNAEEAALLEKDGAGTVFVGEAELARAMTLHVLKLVPEGTGSAGLRVT
jgi:CPA2 family monovalent cation:H+ antiporter-2